MPQPLPEPSSRVIATDNPNERSIVSWVPVNLIGSAASFLVGTLYKDAPNWLDKSLISQGYGSYVYAFSKTENDGTAFYFTRPDASAVAFEAEDGYSFLPETFSGIDSTMDIVVSDSVPVPTAGQDIDQKNDYSQQRAKRITKEISTVGDTRSAGYKREPVTLTAIPATNELVDESTTQTLSAGESDQQDLLPFKERALRTTQSITTGGTRNAYNTDPQTLLQISEQTEITTDDAFGSLADGTIVSQDPMPFLDRSKRETRTCPLDSTGRTEYELDPETGQIVTITRTVVEESDVPTATAGVDVSQKILPFSNRALRVTRTISGLVGFTYTYWKQTTYGFPSLLRDVTPVISGEPGGAATFLLDIREGYQKIVPMKVVVVFYGTTAAVQSAINSLTVFQPQPVDTGYNGFLFSVPSASVIMDQWTFSSAGSAFTESITEAASEPTYTEYLTWIGDWKLVSYAVTKWNYNVWKLEKFYVQFE